MELHNTIKSTIISEVNKVFENLKAEKTPGKFCTCDHCRMDVICYVLNRTPPRYIVSNRGASRVLDEGLGWQQQTIDINSLIYEGLNKVNINLRPGIIHSSEEKPKDQEANIPKFNIPAIMGRLFNGSNFAPISDVYVELLWEGELVKMKDGNWQNPFRVVANVEGNFSFWPAPMPAEEMNSHRIFEYTLRVVAPEMQTLNHIFKIPVASEIQAIGSFNLERTFKLPDLYMFPPGDVEQNG